MSTGDVDVENVTIAIPMGAPGQQVAEGRLSLQDKQAAAAAIAAIDTSRDDEVKEAYLYDSRTGLSKTKELRSEALKAKQKIRQLNIETEELKHLQDKEIKLGDAPDSCWQTIPGIKGIVTYNHLGKARIAAA